MSDSDSESPIARRSKPNHEAIETALRSIVKDLQNSGDSEELTVNNVRSLAVARLGVDSDFFHDGTWKSKSKAIIRDQADKEPDGEGNAPAKNGRKRKSPNSAAAENRKAVKKRRVSDGSSAISEISVVTDANEQETTNQSKGKQAGHSDDEDGSSLSSVQDDDEQEPEITKVADSPRNMSDSELSVLIDDGPSLPKKRSKKEPKSKSTTKKRAPKPKKEAEPSDPDKEEIKRLQGWLVKCGIRKLWGKELAPYESNKAKIRHLKQMLSDVGMTGRYSVDKARQIKEARELAADLEAVQEGNKAWGKDVSGDEEDKPRPRQRLARGLKELDFISDEESE